MRPPASATPAMQRAEAEMAARSDALKIRTRADLLSLPPVSTENIQVGKYRIMLSTYRDLLPEDAIRIAFQAAVIGPWYSLMNWVMAQGFLMSPTGDVRTAEQQELDEFL